MNGKFLVFVCGVYLICSVAGESPPKIIHRVPEVTKGDIENRSFLRLVTPSGNIYHFRDDAKLVLEIKGKGENEFNTLPFITYGPPFGTKYYIQFPSEQSDFKLFAGTDKSGRDSVDGDLQLRTFTGPNRERYSVAHFNIPVIRKIDRVEDDIVNYLQIVFEYNSEVYAFTFSQNGDELTKTDNCTDSIFLTLAFPSGKVQKIKQSSQSRDGTEDVTNVSNLPFISFFHVDGAKYDIQFPVENSNAHTEPSIARDTLRDRERCSVSVLSRFVGPDGREYRFEVIDFKPTITALPSEETEDKIKIHFLNPSGQTVNYDYSRDGELLGLSMASSAIGVETNPAKPFNIKDVEFNCLQNCD